MLRRERTSQFHLAPSRAVPVRRARFSAKRRDPRRFGQASQRILDTIPAEPETSDNLRLFAHSFAGFFLFFSLLIA